MQCLIHTGRLNEKRSYKAVANSERTKCVACEFGNFHCRSNKVNKIKNNPLKYQELKKDDLLPGQMVSVDHYILRDPGRLYHTKGKSDPYEMCVCVCVCVC